MTVGCFGGTFDPPHLGHLKVARCAQDQYGLDEVWWIPSYSPPHKDSADVSSFQDRLEMTRLAIRGRPRMVACDIEIGLPQPSYTIATLTALQRRQPMHSLVLVMGQDSLVQFGTWHRPQAIAHIAQLLVYPRDGSPKIGLPPYLAGRVQLMDVESVAIESAAIRARVRDRRPFASYVADPVRAYIERHGLYRTRSAISDPRG